MPTGRAVTLLIAAAIVVGLAARLATWTGMIASDDLTHAWAALHVWDDPIEHAMPDGPGSPYTVNARRVGVNLPLAAAVAVAGPTEAALGAVPLVASLLGILACAAWAGALAGRRAAVVAAWLAAVLPIDVWQATIWLQDSLYAAGLAAAMAAGAWAVRTGQPRWWLITGLCLGYLQYVKESAAILVVVFAVAGLVRSIRARRLDRGTLWLLLGVAAVQIAATLYWWKAMGDPTYYVRAWLGRQADLEAVPAMKPFPHNLVRLGLYVGYHLALGVGGLVAGAFAVRWLRRGAAPARIRHDALLVGAVQLVLLIHVLRWGASTQRYLLQLTPFVIALGAAGLAEAWPARSPRWRTVALAAVIATTALGLVVGRPQHGRFRADVARRLYAALPTLAPADTPVYVVITDHPGHYTDRALALLDGYRHDRFHVVTDPHTVTRGLVVYSNTERHPARPVSPPGRKVFATATPGDFRWLEVYAVGLP